MAYGYHDKDYYKAMMSEDTWKGFSTPIQIVFFTSGLEHPEINTDGLSAFTQEQKKTVARVVADIESFSNLDLTVGVKNPDYINPSILLGNKDLPGNIAGQSSMPISIEYANYYHTILTKVDVAYTKFTENDFDTFSQQTIYHELGHAIGLKHPAEQDPGGLEIEDYQSTLFSTMNYSDIFYGSDFDRLYPNGYMAADILAIQMTYGADFSSRSGNNVYRFESLSGSAESYRITDNGKTYYNDGLPVLTIWDGGGKDTYDYSKVNHGVEIDLRAGAYSILLKETPHGPRGFDKLGTIQNSYLFEGDKRSLIENAAGTKFADRLIGNELANTLSGGRGNDILSGGKGNDTFVFLDRTGHDTVRDFVEGDHIDLRKVSAITSMSDLFSHHIEYTKAGVLIDITSADSILLSGIKKGGVDAGDFLV